MGLFAALKGILQPEGDKPLIARDATAVPSASASESSILRPRRHALALEPRVMFDGAAASAVDQQHGGDTTRPPEAPGTDRTTAPSGQASGVAQRTVSAAAEAAPEAVAQSGTPAPQHLLVIDSRVEQRDQLLAQVAPDVKVLVVDTQQDGLAAISAALAQMGQVDSIQILSHGGAGQFRLGSVTVSADNVDQLGPQLQGWRTHLTDDADIQLYGCDVGAGAAGQSLVNELARWTGADVGASSDDTGAAAAGGNWTLETRAGDVDKALVLSAATQAAFDGLLADATPTVSLSSGGDDVVLGSTFTVTASFTNPSSQVGYAPYIDVFIPVTGKDGAGTEVDDGITFVSATFEGQAIVVVPVVFDASGQAPHPLAKDANGQPVIINAATYGLRPGDQLMVLQLPNASIINGQPAVNIVMTFQLSNLADTALTDAAPDLTIRARGGFQFGNTSADDPTIDPSLIEASLHDFVVHPTMVELTQTANVPDGETVTGPNYSRSITVTATTAADQALSNVVIAQDLPNTIRVTSIVPGTNGTVTSITLQDGRVLTNGLDIAVALSGAGAYLSHYEVTYSTMTGSVGTTVNFYVPEVDANGTPVLDPTTGAPRTIDIAAPQASATWTPLDTRDIPISGNTLSGSGDPASFVVKSIVVYKEPSLVNDVGSAGPTPGDTLQYRLEVDISDYFAFGRTPLNNGFLVITDEATNGQTLVAGSGRFTVTMNGQTLDMVITPTVVTNPDGSTTMTLDLAQTLRDNGQLLAGIVGDLAFDDTLTGATIGVITYQTTINQAYDGNFPHDPINEGDSVGNNATVSGTVLIDPVNTGGTASDGDSTTVDIPVSAVEIIVSTVNGQPAAADVELRPGDIVTFQISYDLLTGDYENFSLAAYMPLPLFDVNGVVWTQGSGVNQWAYGPNQTATDTLVANPVSDVNGNFITFDFGNHASPFVNGSRVEILFTMQVGDTPFGDQRKVTVIARSDQLTTLDGQHLVSEDAAVISSIAEPVLAISHGVVSSSAGTVSGTTGTWAPPLDGGAPFTIPVTDIAAVNGDVTGIDGADYLRMATAIENSGGGGAYDVVTSVNLPAGLSFVGNALSSTLRVFRGDGTELTVGVDFVVDDTLRTVTFLDPTPGQASLLPGRADSDANRTGQNVVVLVYDVQVAPTIAASATLQSTAVLNNYAAANGGDDFTPVDLTDLANQQVAAPTITKVFADGVLDPTDSSAAHTTGSDLVIGETMLYDIVVTLPEGNATNLRIDDLIPAGLALDMSFNGGQGYQIITVAGAGGSGALTADFAGVLTGGTPEGIGGTIGQDGVDGRISFTASTNNADNSTANNSFVIRVRLVASNTPDNQSGRVLANNAQLTYSDPDGDVAGGTTPIDRTVALGSATPNVTVQEPTLAVTQTVEGVGPLGVDAGDPLVYVITISNTSGFDAFDLSFNELFPAQLGTLVIESVTPTNATAAVGDFAVSGAQLSSIAGANIDIAAGGSIVIRVSTTVGPNAPSVATLDSTASVQWTSLNGVDSTPATGERTGADGVLNGGQLNDYRVDSLVQVPVLAGIQISRIGGVADTPPASGGTDGSNEQVVVGELVRYRVVSAIPEGLSLGYVIEVTLDGGLTFLNDGTIRLAFISTNGISTELIFGDPSFQLSGNRDSTEAQPISTDLLGAGPNGVFPAGRVESTTDAQGRTVLRFNIGALVNNDGNDADLEGISLEFNARVANAAGNQAGASLGVSARVLDAEVEQATSNVIYEDVVEPVFSGMVKQVDSFQANADASTSTANVSVRFTQSGSAPAYDVQLLDSFTGLSGSGAYTATSLTIGSQTYVIGTDALPAGVTFTASDTGISVNFSRLDAGTVVVVNYVVRVGNDTAYANTDAVLTWSSLPETFTTWGGSGVGADGTADGERTGADGPQGGGALNDYRLSEGAGLGLINGTLWDDSFSPTTDLTPDGTRLTTQTVTLTWAGADGSFGTGDDAVYTTATDSGGFFHFSGLAAGNYRVDAPTPVTVADPIGPVRVRIDTDAGTLGQVSAAMGEGASSGANFGYVQINDAPVNTVPGQQNGQEDTDLAIQPLSVADADVANAPGGVLTVTLAVGQGTLTYGVTPAPGLQISGSGSNTITMTGTAADINAVLGALIYRGNLDYNGNDTLVITTRDNGNFGDADNDGIPGESSDDNLTDVDTVAIVLAPVNDQPKGVDDNALALEAGGAFNTTPGINPTGNILANDTDVDIRTNGDVLHLTRVANSLGDFITIPDGDDSSTEYFIGGQYGTLFVRANGTARYEVDNNNSLVEALRLSGQTLTETFTYNLADAANWAADETPTLTITIQGANDTPLAEGDTGDALEAGGVNNGTAGSNATGNVLLGDASGDVVDTDVDGGADDAGTVPDYGEVLTVTGIRNVPISEPGTMTPVVTGTDTVMVGTYGTLTISATGAYTYVVNNDHPDVQALSTSSAPLEDVFSYEITDAGGLSNAANLTIRISGAFDNPVASDDVAQAQAQGFNAANQPIGTESNPRGNLVTDATRTDGVPTPGTGVDSDVDAIDNPNTELLVNAIRTGAEATPGLFTDVTGPITIDGSYGRLTISPDGSYSYDVDSTNAAVRALQVGDPPLQDIFTYRIVDHGNLTDTAQLTINVLGANDGPVAQDVSAAAVEAGGIANGTAGTDPQGDVLGTSQDPDGDPLTVIGIRTGTEAGSGTAGTVGQALQGTYGALTLDSAGQFTYVVDNSNAFVQALRQPTDTLSETFTFTIGDGQGGQDTAQIVVTIAGRNDNPVGRDDAGTIVEAGGINNTPPSVNATGNVLLGDSGGGVADTDVDGGADDGGTVPDYGETKVVSSFGAGSETAPQPDGAVGVELRGTYGWLTLNADGSYSYRLDDAMAEVQALRQSTDTLQDLFHYTVSDAAAAPDIATLTITITGANDNPVARDDAGAALEAGGVGNGTVGAPATGNVLDNDDDVDRNGETEAVQAFALQGGGAGTLGTAFAARYGTMTLNADGSYTYVVDDGNPTVQALVAGQTLQEFFDYTMVDALGLTASATLTITITGANDAPDATNDFGFADEAGGVANGTPGTPATGNVLGNDTDPDTGETTQLIVSAVQTGGGTAGDVGTALRGLYGSLTLNADGSYTYVVDNDNADVQALRLSLNTLQDVFTYTARDRALINPAGQTDQAQLLITIRGANDNPVAANDEARAIEAGGVANGTPGAPATGNVLGNDTDVDRFGETQAVQAFELQGGGAGTVGTPFTAAHGTLTLGAGGNFIYVVDNDDLAVQRLLPGQTLREVFNYTVVDAGGLTSTATLTIVIEGADDTPDAVDDLIGAMEAGGVANSTPGIDPRGNLLANDTDVDDADPRTLDGIRAGTDGTDFTSVGTLLAVNVTGRFGTLTVHANGTYSYAVDNDAVLVQRMRGGNQDSLIDTFSYRAVDRAGQSDTAQVIITIDGAWDTPVARNDVDLAVAGIIRDPLLNAVNASGNVLFNDTDVDQPDTKTVTAVGVGEEAAGPALSPVATSLTVTGLYGTLTINADGRYTYEIDIFNLQVQALQPGQHLDEYFTYQVTDAGALSDLAQIHILVRGQNNPPLALPDVGVAVEAGGLNNQTPGSDARGNVLADDSDIDGDAISVTGIRTGGLHEGGTAGTVDGVALRGQWGDLFIQADGTYRYVVDNDLPQVQALRVSGQTLRDVFTYTVSDSLGASESTEMVMVVEGRNDTPIALDDHAEAIEAGGVNNTTPGTDAVGNVLDNDSDVDGVAYGETEQVDHYTRAGGATVQAGGSLAGLYGALVIQADGSWRYVIDNDNPTVQALRTSGETLTETFSYVMRDTAGAISQANLVIVVRGADDNPVARDDSNYASDQVVAPQARGNVLPNDSDVDGGDALHVGAVRAGAESGSGAAGTLGQPLAGRYGTLVLNADGSYTYSIDMSNPEVLAAAGFGRVLQDVFTYTAVDRAGATDQAQLVISLDISAPRIDSGEPDYWGRFQLWPREPTTRLNVEPGLFVQPVVRQDQVQQLIDRLAASGTEAGLVLDRSLMSAPTSFTYGLTGVDGEYVGDIVRNNALAAQLDLLRLLGRHGRVSLSADGLLSDPSLFGGSAQSLTIGPAQRQVPDREVGGQRTPLAQASTTIRVAAHARPEPLPAAQIDEPLPQAPAAAAQMTMQAGLDMPVPPPSLTASAFSAQLQQAAARLHSHHVQ